MGIFECFFRTNFWSLVIFVDAKLFTYLTPDSSKEVFSESEKWPTIYSKPDHYFMQKQFSSQSILWFKGIKNKVNATHLTSKSFFMTAYHKVITEQEIFKWRVSSCSGADCKHLGEGRKIEFHNVKSFFPTTSKWKQTLKTYPNQT